MSKRKIVGITAAALVAVVGTTGVAWATISDDTPASYRDLALEQAVEDYQIQKHEEWIAHSTADIADTVQAEIDNSASVVAAKEAAAQRAKAKASRRASYSGSSSSRSSSSSSSSSSGGSGNATLESIARCESGGNPNAVSSSGKYRGKYQFDRQTWQSVGGSGDPASASEAEQDRRAAQLYSQRGSSPWANCS